MKTAEDFRRDFGETEESFRACVRQTLTALECKEEKPVKKRNNMVLILAMITVLLTGTAIADEQWGILRFLRNQGKTAEEDQLLTLNTPEPYTYGEYELVDAVMTEALYEDGKLYLAVAVKPLQENTLVIPMPGADQRAMNWGSTHINNLNLQSLTMQEAMQRKTYGDVFVLDYAKAHGFDQVVVVEAYHVRMDSTQRHWLHDRFEGLQHVEYSLLADGTLQLILETGYQPDLTFADERRDMASITMRVWAFDVQKDGEFLYGSGDGAHASFVIPDNRVRLRSIPEDAHDIVGYIGEVEYISITPYDDEYMAFTVQLNLRDDATEDTWMSGPAWVVVDGEGNRLCKVDTTKYYGLSTAPDEAGARRTVTRGVFPAVHMPADGTITLRAENRVNSTIVYDEYTYTLVEAAEEEQPSPRPE